MNCTLPVGRFSLNTTATLPLTCVMLRLDSWRPAVQSPTESREQSDAPERRSQAIWQWRINRRRQVIGDVLSSDVC
jgi:hypothetical protein